MLTIRTTPHFQPEKTYIFQVLLGELLGLSWQIEWADVQHYEIGLPNGATLVVEDHFWANVPADYLQPHFIPATALTLPHPLLPDEWLTCIYGRPEIAQTSGSIVSGFDVFASAFFMLTRWEEYALPDRDAHGRFPATKALAVRAGFLDRPVVNEYAALLALLLTRLGVTLPVPQRHFQLILTCDVDHPRKWWSLVDRLKTLGGSIFKRKNLREMLFWVQNDLLQRRDPYDVFDNMMDAAEQAHTIFHFNFLSRRPVASDCYYPLAHPFIQKLLQKIAARRHVIGFHPSYEAYEDAPIFIAELAALRTCTAAPVVSGRQHYLRFAAPYTWQRWEDAGMEWDSTLGYAEAEGFRCGVCCSFPVFNFLTRTTLRLRERPLIAMDVTLAQYRGYTPQQAIGVLQKLRAEVVKHRGEFVLLWHNSSLNDYHWAVWKTVYQSLFTRT